MSHFTPRRARPLTKPKVGSPSRRILVSALGLGLAAGAAIFGLAAAGPDETLARTGELNAMGLPVVETPGTGDGTAEAAGVVVERHRAGVPVLDVFALPGQAASGGLDEDFVHR